MILRCRFRVPEDFETIGQALAALPASGGLIEVGPGLYHENLVRLGPGVVISGCNPPGPCWTAGSTPLCAIVGSSGTLLDLGCDNAISDPGTVIEGMAFLNSNGGACAYGLRARRFRNLTLRDCQFINFQPAGTALFLDGTGLIGDPGWHEWAHIENTWFSNCFQSISALNTTKLTVLGGGVINVSIASIPGSVGLETSGTSDTLRMYGWGTLEVASPVILNGSPWEYAQIEGLRVEAHTGVSVGIQVNTSSNYIAGSYYGLKTWISFSATATGNRYLKGLGGGLTGTEIVDLGTGNTSI